MRSKKHMFLLTSEHNPSHLVTDCMMSSGAWRNMYCAEMMNVSYSCIELERYFQFGLSRRYIVNRYLFDVWMCDAFRKLENIRLWSSFLENSPEYGIKEKQIWTSAFHTITDVQSSISLCGVLKDQKARTCLKDNELKTKASIAFGISTANVEKLKPSNDCWTASYQ